MGRWDQLPVDLLKKIDEHIELYDDKVRSKCVCTHWERAFPELSDLQQPLLLLPFTGGSSCGLFHPFEKKLLVVDLPEVGEEKVFKGSDHGWVVTVQHNGSINAVNPLTRALFALPPRHKFPDVLKYRPDKRENEYLFERIGKRRDDPIYRPLAIDSMSVRNYHTYKIALSCAPTCSDGFRAVALHGPSNRLAYCKLGDKKWSDLVQSEATCGYRDFTFCGGKLYALTYKRELMVCDDIVSCPVLRKLLPTWEGFGLINTNIHLVNSSDGGIMVVRRREDCRRVQEMKFIFRTFDFEVYKLDLSGPGWIRMQSLGSDEILFMGLGAQFGIRGTDGNRIYFSDDNLNFNCQDVEDCFDSGIFRFEDKKVKPLGYEFNPQMIFPSPIWVMPNPY